MKFGVVNKSTTEQICSSYVKRNITHSAVITRKSNIKLGILKGGKLEKSPKVCNFSVVKNRFEIFDFFGYYLGNSCLKKKQFNLNFHLNFNLVKFEIMSPLNLNEKF